MHGTGIKIIDSAASIGGHEMNMKYVSFPWPAVVATHDRKRLAQTLHSIRSYWLRNNYPYAQHSVISIVSYHSLQTMQKIPHQNCIWYKSQYGSRARQLNMLEYIHHRLFLPMVSSMWHFPILFIRQHHCCNY